jgi:hypothetical protein
MGAGWRPCTPRAAGVVAHPASAEQATHARCTTLPGGTSVLHRGLISGTSTLRDALTASATDPQATTQAAPPAADTPMDTPGDDRPPHSHHITMSPSSSSPSTSTCNPTTPASRAPCVPAHRSSPRRRRPQGSPSSPSRLRKRPTGSAAQSPRQVCTQQADIRFASVAAL